jgi:hypothetical protein
MGKPGETIIRFDKYQPVSSSSPSNEPASGIDPASN